MKYFTFLILLLTVTFACKQPDRSKTLTTDVTKDMVEVIDFYGTHRCTTCKNIEANAQYTVETLFEKEVKAGKLVFKTVNVDDDANYDIAERFEAAGTALFLNVINDGVENHIDLTNFAFEKGNDKEVFSTELKQKIEEQLAVL
jgi:hypothetical protein